MANDVLHTEPEPTGTPAQSSGRARKLVIPAVVAAVLIAAIVVGAIQAGGDGDDPNRKPSGDVSKVAGGLSDADTKTFQELGIVNRKFADLQVKFAQAEADEDPTKMHALAQDYVEAARDIRDKSIEFDDRDLRSKAVNAGSSFVRTAEAMLAVTEYMTDESIPASDEVEAQLSDELTEAAARAQEADRELLEAVNDKMSDKQREKNASTVREYKEQIDAAYE